MYLNSKFTFIRMSVDELVQNLGKLNGGWDHLKQHRYSPSSMFQRDSVSVE